MRFLVFMAILVMMTSCSKEVLMEDIQSTSNEKMMTKSSNQHSIDIIEVAKLLSTIEVDDSVMAEVKEAVDRSLKYGLGYNYRFNDILKPQESKVLRTLDTSRKLADILKQKYSDQIESSLVHLDQETFFSILADSKYMIRWPYANKWNGVDKPIIAFASEYGSILYKPELQQDGTFLIDSISATKENVEKNPIWLVTESHLTYEELPDFENGEFFNDEGTFFYSPYAVEKMNLKSSKLGKKGLYIVNMCFLEHYEGIGFGEFEFYWQSVPNGIGTSKKIMNYSSENIVDETLQVDLLLKSVWDVSEYSNGLVILEKDGGVNKKGYQVLQYMERVGSSLKNISVPYSYEKRDEIVMNTVWNRLSLCDDKNNTFNDGSLKKYYGLNNGFWITFKYYE